MKIKSSNFFTFTIDEKPSDKAIEAEKELYKTIKERGERQGAKCSVCANSRFVVSENGYFPVCCLPYKKATLCLIGEKDAYVPAAVPSKEDNNVNCNI